MGFQPTSPIRLFNTATTAQSNNKKNKLSKNSVIIEQPQQPKKPGMLERLASKRTRSRPIFKTPLGDDVTSMTVSPNSSIGDGRILLEKNTAYSPISAISPYTRLDIKTNIERLAVYSADSSPTDPSYIPGTSERRGRLTDFTLPPRHLSYTSARTISSGEQSFFDSDTESESEVESDDVEPVVERASSVRMAKPRVVQQSLSTRQKAGRIIDPSVPNNEDSVSTIIHSSSEVDGAQTVSNSDVARTKAAGDPTDALDRLEGRTLNRTSVSPSFWHLARDLTDTSEKSGRVSKRSALSSNPVTKNDQSSVQRTISDPAAAPRSSSKRKVQIRPSSLVISPTQHNTRLFREAVVTTPYPRLDRLDEKSGESDSEGDVPITELPRRSGTMNSAYLVNDRFPSPDRSEILFLDLGLAGHPCATMTLEIKIADRSVFDDEMLFRQIKNAYNHRLLGRSRLAFSLVRGVAHATSSASVAYDFKTADFMKHFKDPRVGRKRKTWIIWIRYHSRQHKSEKSNHHTALRRPLSASLRTTDRRLSQHWDTSPASDHSLLSLTRVPFFSKQTRTSSPAFSRYSPPSEASESSMDIIKIELHHGFSVWTLALLHLWTGIASIAAVVLWVVFGVPGTSPLEKGIQGAAGTFVYGLSWSMAAQTRVLTGLVLGMMVAILGAMIELCLVTGAYVLL